MLSRSETSSREALVDDGSASPREVASPANDHPGVLAPSRLVALEEPG
jgi:hypothetical protein